MHGQQGLVGGHYVLAGFDSLHDQLARNAVTTDQLDDDVNVRVGNDGPRIADDLDRRPDRGLRTRSVEVGHHGDCNATSGTAKDFFLVALQHIEHTAAYGTDTEKTHLDGRQIA